MAKLIEFKKERYWFLGNSFKERGAIAPLEHCDERGNIKPDCIFELSYAHYIPNVGIKRFRNTIGSLKDIKVIK